MPTNVDNDVLALIQTAASKMGRWICQASFVQFGIEKQLVSRMFNRYSTYIEHQAARYGYDIRIRRKERWLDSRGSYESWELAAVMRGW